MTKREAIFAAIAGAIGLMSNRAKAETITLSGTTITTITQMPQSVMFDLDTFKEFKFTQGGESVTLTGKEIFAALKSH